MVSKNTKEYLNLTRQYPMFDLGKKERLDNKIFDQSGSFPAAED